MTSLRQKPKLSLETPVLFRLPDLRIHQAHKVSGWPTAVDSTAVARDNDSRAVRIDAPQTAVPAASSMPEVSRLTASQAAAPPLEASASTSTAVPVARSRSATAEEKTSSPPARGWMERFGSRLILVVTLLVIMTAAWVTGQRIPASKSAGTDVVASNADEDSEGLVDALSTPDLSKVDGASSQLAQTPEVGPVVPSESVETLPSAPIMTPTTNVVAKPAIDQSFTHSAAINPAPATPSQEMSATLALEAPRSVHDEEIAPLTDAPAGTPSTSQLTTLSPPLAAGHPATPVQSVAHDMSAKLPPDSAAAMSLAPAAGGFYTGNETIDVLPSAPPVAPAVSPSQATAAQIPPVASAGEALPPASSTPNQLKIDPNVLVPWANEQALNQVRQQSTTPNPIRNWIDYLPASEDSHVRAATATVDPQMQPQVGMPEASSNPVFSNSFYSN